MRGPNKVPGVISVLLLAGMLASCGESSLAGVGDFSRDFVYGSTTTTTTLVVEVEERVIGVVKATDIVWFNDDIEGQRVGVPNYVISSVWGRGNLTDRFIQASRVEIASALPNVTFLELVPEEVGWVTSQLVYDLASGTLDGDISAAFGLWVVEPYTVTDGNIAVLRVGRSGDTATEGQSAITVDPVETGLSLTWNEGQYRYELFCRSVVPAEVCEEIAKTAAPLRLLLPEDAPPIPDSSVDSDATDG
jgi:hypothetical protein